MRRLALSAPHAFVATTRAAAAQISPGWRSAHPPAHRPWTQPRSPRAARPMSAAAAGDAGAAPAAPDPVLQYVILRRDLWKELKWPLGSVVAQGCHAATAALWLSRDDPVTRDYCAPENLDHMHKVVLEATGEAQLRQLAAAMEAAGVVHKLWVEQPEDFPTALATAPAPKGRVAPLVKKLKLCRG